MTMAALARAARIPGLRITPQLAVLWVAAGGILTMTAFVYLAQSRDMMLPLLAACGLLLAVFTVIRPEIGLGALVLCAAAVRISIGTGTDSRLVASLLVGGLLLGCWIAHRMLHRERLILLPTYVVVPAVILIGATFFSLIWGRLTLDPRVIYYPEFIRVQLAASALTVISVGLLFVGADILGSRGARTVVCGVLVVAGAVALPYRALGQDVPVLNTTGLFGLWFVAICWAHALVNARLGLIPRVALGGLAVGWLTMAITREQAWVSGWLPALVAFIAVTLAVRPRLGALFVLVGGGVLAFYNSIFYEMLVTQQKHDGSLGGEFGRLELWQRNLEVIQGHLLFGTGPAGYALYYVTFVPGHAMSTHSNYVDTLAQTGVVGLAGLIMLLAALWVLSQRTLRRTTDLHDRATCAAVCGGVPAVALSLWLGDWLIPFIYNQTIAGFDHSVYSWLMFAMAGGLLAQWTQEQPQDA
jgi:O-antigen ligase